MFCCSINKATSYLFSDIREAFKRCLCLQCGSRVVQTFWLMFINNTVEEYQRTNVSDIDIESSHYNRCKR